VRSRAWPCLLALWLLAACAPLLPQQPGWHAVAPGLSYWRGEPGLHALRVDLRQRRLRLTPFAERGRPLDGFSAAPQALAALNASFFDRRFYPRGHTVSDGEAWPEPMSVNASPLLHCDAGDAVQAQRCRLQLAPPYQLPSGTRTAVAGTPWLIRAGQARTATDDASCPGHCDGRHPRTALGLSADGHHVILLLAEGRRDGVPGLSLAETAAHLLQLGAHEALNLDGGGSSSLLIRGQSVMQRPAREPGLRRIANALLID